MVSNFWNHLLRENRSLPSKPGGGARTKRFKSRIISKYASSILRKIKFSERSSENPRSKCLFPPIPSKPSFRNAEMRKPFAFLQKILYGLWKRFFRSRSLTRPLLGQETKFQHSARLSFLFPIVDAKLPSTLGPAYTREGEYGIRGLRKSVLNWLHRSSFCSYCS